MEKKLNPFEENVQSYDVYELANWIYRCKNHIPKPETPQEEEQYVKKVKAFTSQWEAHREANKELYNSKKYHDALIGSNYSRPKIYAKHGKNRVDISELVYPDRMEWIGSLPTKNGDEFKQLLKNNMIDTIDEYLILVKEAFKHEDYKTYIEGLLKKFFKSAYIQINLVSLEKGTDITKMTKDELLEALNKQNRPKDYYLKRCPTKNEKSSFIRNFEEHCVSKSTYFEWKTEALQERYFDKRFFVVLGLMLGLPKEEFTTFLSFNGYCCCDSKRMFDKIIYDGVSKGYPLRYIYTLINLSNAELEKRFGGNFGKMQPLVSDPYKMSLGTNYFKKKEI